jgi:dethiobiotin synthetase
MDSRGIFIAGSDMNAGKTTLSLGLISWLEENMSGRVSFMKPMGQKTMLFDGESVGEDTFLVNTSLGLDMEQEYTAPFTMSSGMAEKYLSEGRPSDLPKRIRKAYRHLRSRSDIVVVEGTGHPGVGSVFDLCNARVAGIMEIPVLLVLDGGIGRTIDRFALCSCLFHRYSVPILGVVINRVLESKIQKVREFLDPWFGSRGIPVFGYIPFVNSLARPSIGMLGRELGFRVGRNDGDGSAGPAVGFITGFGSTDEILSEVNENPGSALLLSSGREEVLDAILARKLSGSISGGPGAVVLCGGQSGGETWMAEGCRRLGIPLYLTERSAGDSVSLLNRRIFKVEPGESVKIDEIVRTIKASVDLQAMVDALSSRPGSGQGAPERRVSRLRSWFSRILRRR